LPISVVYGQPRPQADVAHQKWIQEQLALEKLRSDPRLPNRSSVDQLEQRLAISEFVGDIRQWDRRYAVGKDGALVSQDHLLEFYLTRLPSQRSGSLKLVPWSKMLDDIANDGDLAVLDGTLDMKTGVISLKACGPNIGWSRHRFPKCDVK
jgi:hypothetical protein